MGIFLVYLFKCAIHKNIGAFEMKQENVSFLIYAAGSVVVGGLSYLLSKIAGNYAVLVLLIIITIAL